MEIFEVPVNYSPEKRKAMMKEMLQREQDPAHQRGVAIADSHLAAIKEAKEELERRKRCLEVASETGDVGKVDAAEQSVAAGEKKATDAKEAFERLRGDSFDERVSETATLPTKVDVSDGPPPLTTGDIAHCFAGLRWDESKWKKPLGDKPKWLAWCVVIPGQRGVSERRWNPVFIGAALVQRGHVKAHNVRAKFQTVDLLRPWLDVWKTYEADNFDSE